jgi:cbb3-type cytochrome oxidase subunit 3
MPMPAAVGSVRARNDAGHLAERAMELTAYLVILIAAFAAIVVWAFGRKRKKRFEKDARIPFDDGKA